MNLIFVRKKIKKLLTYRSHEQIPTVCAVLEVRNNNMEEGLLY